MSPVDDAAGVNHPGSTPEWRRPTLPFVAVATVALLAQSLVALRMFIPALMASPGTTSTEWLVNYAGGFSRRGLIGELLHLTPLEGTSLLLAVWFVQVVATSILIGGTVALFAGTSRSNAWVVLTLSPAFLLFPALNVFGAWRKEVIVLAGLTLLAVQIRWRLSQALIWAACGAYALGSFSHEGSALAVPAFVFLLWWSHRNGGLTRRATAGYAVTFAAICGIALTSAAVWSGTQEQAAAVCASWQTDGLSDQLCQGPLNHLGDTTADALRLVASVSGGIPGYAVPLLLSLLPLQLVDAPRRIWALVAVTYAALLPLFVLGIDYGRWIYLATAAVSLVALAIGPVEGWGSRKVPWWVAAAFLLLWTVPYTFGDGQTALETLASLFDG